MNDISQPAPRAIQAIEEQKHTLRKNVLARRKTMTDEERATKSQQICHALLPYYQQAPGDVVALYSAMKYEVNLDRFARDLYRENASVLFPCMFLNRDPRYPHAMQFRMVPEESYYASMEVKACKARGEQPSEGALADSAPFVTHPMRVFDLNKDEDIQAISKFPLVPPSSIRFMVAPVVAFDIDKNRLGYGGGNYDRYLAQLDERAYVIGVAFTEQRVSRVPTDQHDIKIHILAR